MTLPPYLSRLGPPLLSAGLMASALGTHGFEGPLLRDHAVFLLGGRLWFEGLPPYLGVFDHKGPLVFLPCALGVALGRLLGLDELLATRLFFVLLAVLLALALHRFALRGLGSERAALFSCLLLPCCTLFVAQAASGPNSKIPAMLAELLALQAIGQKRWFLAGLLGMAGILVWPPSLVFLLVGLGLALLEARRRAAVGALLAGALSLLLAFVAYFGAHGAALPMLDATFFFQVLDLWRPESPRATWIPASLTMCLRGYASSFLFLALGLGALLIRGAKSLEASGLLAFLREDPLAPALLAVPWLVGLCLVDFQGPADLFALLPLLCLGAGWLLDQAVVGIGSLGRTAGALIGLVLCGQALLSASLFRERGLDAQREGAAAVAARLGEGRLLSLGAPELLVLLHRRNPNPHPFLISGMDRYVERTWPGGLEGFTRDLDAFAPECVGLGPMNGPGIGRIEAWLDAGFAEPERFGPWTLRCRRAEPGL